MGGSTQDVHPETGAPKANTPGAGANAAGSPSSLEALVAQQTALMNTMMLQEKDLSYRVGVAEAASAKAVTQMAASAQSGDAKLEALRKLPYVPHVAGNPFSTWPSTLESDMPQMYDLYNDKTYEGGRGSGKGGEGADQKGGVASGWRQQRGAELFQCGALLFGWNDSPRIFVKIMLSACRVSAVSSVRRGPPGPEVRKLRSGSMVRKCWAARRRAGGCEREEHQQDARVLPYMDDFLVLTSSKVEALRARELASRVLTRLGIGRNAKKGQWEPTQLVEHLGLEVDLAEGQFGVTPARLQKIHVQAKALLSEASRQRRWLPARWLTGFTGLCQSAYQAVPAARLYPRKLYFVLSTKRGWGSKELTSKVVRLYCNNHAVVAMLSHFTSRSPELMRHMRLAIVGLKRHRAPGEMWFQRLEALSEEIGIMPRRRDLFPPSREGPSC
ncbi:hypothetical protein CYMTET_50237 [Cymbomonas tetramitiformis]|uniref:Reverse transcriptase domain-containing protein n=1 Tax=Cymbomonas tetramitiformis TaxID=36881 RepID=A0AAE0EUY6_9CHLO|nr:hypothetical protein CYMTET_50237 [Cymbomonas tetramitiformis]